MIRSSLDEAVLVLTIDRTERRNALDGEHCDALTAALAAAPEAREIGRAHV